MNHARKLIVRQLIFAGITVSLATVCFSGMALGVTNRHQDRRLNFLFILIDDLGWADLGCYGSQFYETPNLDRLAAEGVRFTDAYAAGPVCSPTRASIMTGKYPVNVGITDWIPGNEPSAEPLSTPRNKQPYLPLEEITVAEALKEAGYATGFVGKWHLGDRGHFPEDQGFDVNIGGCHLGSPIYGYFSPYHLPSLKDGPVGEYLTDRLTDEAIGFLERSKEKPFFLFMSYYTVHRPIHGKPALVEKYEAKAKTMGPKVGPLFKLEGTVPVRQVQDHPIYAAMVQCMDDNVGRLLSKLDELGLTDNTVVIFTSDNGGLSTADEFPTSNVPLRAGKGWLYEGGIREPLIVRWPSVVRAGSTCREVVCSPDFYPTILQLADLPLRPMQHSDGQSFADVLKGDQTKVDRQAVYWHYPHYTKKGSSPASAIRMGRYKLIEFFERGNVELYDLGNDIGEQSDLSETMPAKRDELHALLRRWRHATEAEIPQPKPWISKARTVTR